MLQSRAQVQSQRESRAAAQRLALTLTLTELHGQAAVIFGGAAGSFIKCCNQLEKRVEEAEK